MNTLKKLVFTLFIFQASISTAQTIIPSSPEINVESYILMDASTGKIIASGNPDSQIEPASMTKSNVCLCHSRSAEAKTCFF